MDLENLLKYTILLAIKTNIIHFKPFSWCFGLVDIIITSKMFSDGNFVMSVCEDNWEGGPEECVAENLTSMVINGDIHLRNIKDVFGGEVITE